MIPRWYVHYDYCNGNHYYTTPPRRIVYEDDRGYVWEHVVTEQGGCMKPFCHMEEDKIQLDTTDIL